MEGRLLLSGGYTEFPAPSPNPFGMGQSIARGPDGNLYFSDSDGLGRITPGGTVTILPIPDDGGTPGPFGSTFHDHGTEGVALGPDGRLWISAGDRVGKLNADGTLTFYALPDGARAGQMTAGPDGNLWFLTSKYAFTGDPALSAFAMTSGIGKVTPAGQVTEFALPNATSIAGGITAAPDGAVWVAMGAPSGGNDAIDRVAPDGTVTEFVVGPSFGGISPDLTGITTGLDGNLWFSYSVTYADGKIGRMTPTGVVTEFALPPGSSPVGITAGPGGGIWFVTGNSLHPVGRINTDGTNLAVFDFPADLGAIHNPLQGLGITTGPDGALWFTEGMGNAIGRLDPSQANPDPVNSPPPNPGPPVTGTVGDPITTGPVIITPITSLPPITLIPDPVAVVKPILMIAPPQPAPVTGEPITVSPPTSPEPLGPIPIITSLPTAQVELIGNEVALFHAQVRQHHRTPGGPLALHHVHNAHHQAQIHRQGKHGRH
jgi:virginiamycin B lyase